MRKVILAMNVSLDGYVARRDGDLSWIFPNFDDELLQDVQEALRQIDTFLLGRVNYQEQAAHWPQSSEPIAPLMNEPAKIVFSKTLSDLEWNNSRLAVGDAAQEIARLKAQPGKNIGVPGGARFAQYLSKQRLIDEYRLTIHPVVLGSGMPLFGGPIDLKLVSTQAYATGAVLNIYQPAHVDAA